MAASVAKLSAKRIFSLAKRDFLVANGRMAADFSSPVYRKTEARRASVCARMRDCWAPCTACYFLNIWKYLNISSCWETVLSLFHFTTTLMKTCSQVQITSNKNIACIGRVTEIQKNNSAAKEQMIFFCLFQCVNSSSCDGILCVGYCPSQCRSLGLLTLCKSFVNASSLIHGELLPVGSVQVDQIQCVLQHSFFDLDVELSVRVKAW